ncbi:MAG: hypothetical protein V4503_01570 [Gemmatimonadota bacterium]
MLIPVLVSLLIAAPSTTIPTYQLRVDLYRGVDTVTTTLRTQEGLVGRVLVEQGGLFTRINSRVRRSPTAGCLLVNVSYAMAGTQEAVDKMTVEPLPVMQLCDATTGRATVDELSYRVTVRELPEAQ